MEHDPLLVTVSRTQTSWAIPTQVWPAGQFALTVHTVAWLTLHVPVTGQLASMVHCVRLVRLHTPVAASAATGPAQSPSQTSPRLSPSAFAWLLLGVRTQLSLRSWTLSLSRSLDLSQAAPLPPAPGAWNGL